MNSVILKARRQFRRLLMRRTEQDDSYLPSFPIIMPKMDHPSLATTSSENNIECPICFEAYQEDSLPPLFIDLDGCGHTVCQDCLFKLAENGRACSICRTPFPDLWAGFFSYLNKHLLASCIVVDLIKKERKLLVDKYQLLSNNIADFGKEFKVRADAVHIEVDEKRDYWKIEERFSNFVEALEMYKYVDMESWTWVREREKRNWQYEAATSIIHRMLHENNELTQYLEKMEGSFGEMKNEVARNELNILHELAEGYL